VTRAERAAYFAAQFDRAREKARVSAARYAAALEKADAARVASAADAAALDAGFLAVMARHLRRNRARGAPLVT
jgi:hypothetical protein